MELAYLLAFSGGLLAGIVVAMMVSLRVGPDREDAPLPPNIGQITCQPAGSITFPVSAPATFSIMQLVAYYTYVYTTLPSSLPDAPPSGAVAHDPTSPLVHPSAPAGGFVVVWAQYTGYTKSAREYACGSGSSGGRSVGNKLQPMKALPVQFDAFPASYRIEPAPSAPSASGGAASELVGYLARPGEAVLRYVAEASTPAEPLWRALGGPVAPYEATLTLLHRTGGTGAVLTVTVLGARRVHLTWVTSDWKFTGVNRLRSESDEPGMPVLVVAPA